jgi:4-hydroxy-2-oxoglutarate aldolase
MAARALAGVMAPVVTTFDGSGAVAPGPFVANARRLLDAGLAGIVVAGSTGEAALLDEEERNALVEAVRPAIPADRWLIVGIGAESTRLTTRRARMAAERGADAVLVVAPHYYGTQAMTPAALRAHYRQVADESPVPVLLYNIPKYMHFALPPEVVAELAAHENVAGMKDSSGDLALFEQYLAARSASFAVLTGNGGQLLPAMERGAVGGILAVSLFAIDESTGGNLAAIQHQMIRAGRKDAATRAQAKLALLSKEIVAGLGVPGIKHALDLVGLAGGAPRMPWLPLDEPGRARVAALLAAGADVPAVATG